jgi:hypothetical protein
MRSLLRSALLATSVVGACCAFTGCSSEPDQPTGKIGNAMDKMDTGKMKNPMDADSGKMEGAMDKMEGGKMKGAMDKTDTGKMDGATDKQK